VVTGVGVVTGFVTVTGAEVSRVVVVGVRVVVAVGVEIEGIAEVCEGTSGEVIGTFSVVTAGTV
jgi:hypothetical protein